MGLQMLSCQMYTGHKDNGRRGNVNIRRLETRYRHNIAGYDFIASLLCFSIFPSRKHLRISLLYCMSRYAFALTSRTVDSLLPPRFGCMDYCLWTTVGSVVGDESGENRSLFLVFTSHKSWHSIFYLSLQSHGFLIAGWSKLSCNCQNVVQDDNEVRNGWPKIMITKKI